MSIQKALVATSALIRRVQPGKQALKAFERGKVVEAGSIRVVDSLDLDSATRNAAPDEPRWDYLLGTNCRGTARVIGLEIHPATSGQVKVVIAKKKAAVRVVGREFARGRSVSGWYWVASGTTAITGTSREARLLAAEGIRLMGGVLRLVAT